MSATKIRTENIDTTYQLTLGNVAYISVGNTIVNVQINSTSFSGTANNSSYFGGQLPAYYQTVSGLASNVATLTANSATYLNGLSGGGYQTTAGLSANVATLTSNNSLYLGGTAAASYQLNSTLNANIASYLPNYTGVVNASSYNVSTTFVANSSQVKISTPVSANGGVGTSGQVLTSNGATGAPYWATLAVGGSIPSTFSGLVVTANTSAVTATANYVSLFNGTYFYTASSPSVTINPASSGANGLDTGTVSSNTWYYVFLIYNGSSVAGLISASSTAPSLPSGYTYKARIGAVRYGSGTLLPSIQYGNRAQYIANGNFPNMGDPGGSSVSVSSFVPATAGAIVVGLYKPNNNSTAYIAANPNYNGYDAIVWVGTNGNFGVPNVLQAVVLLESGNIYGNAGGGTIWAQGWIDNL